jgi:tetratricopeptide (TPR) repeat protein
VYKIWTGLVVCCSIFCVLPGLAFSQEPAQFESLLASAQDAQARSDFLSAAKFYQQAVNLHPEIPELQANLGLMYYETGKDEQASEAFRHALRLKPGLFVPNLFLGLELVKSKRFSEAIPCLKQAALGKPDDVQVQFGLGQAYAGSGKIRLATAAYSRAAQLGPGNADAWYHLGVNYLEQVEADARILLTRHRESAYVQALMAETFAEQRALIQAENAYKNVLALPKFPAGAHAAYSFVLLNRHDLEGAERELSAELAANPGSQMAKLGMARLHLEQGATAKAAKEIGQIWETDTGFMQANASLFRAGLAGSKRGELQSALQELQASGDIPPEIAALFGDPSQENLLTGPAGRGTDTSTRSAKDLSTDAAKLYASGSYGQCRDVLASRPQPLAVKNLQLLASCAYLTGDYPSALKASGRLAQNPSTEAEGLYWETKAAGNLATQSFARASAADPGSPKLHVLLGDIYRQQKNIPEAEKEYRRALSLRPGDTGAQFGLSLALLAAGQNDEALSLAQTALEKNPDDPELNAVMGEILCARNEYADAEPFLKKSLNTKPEFVSRVHALLGNVYAKTNRTQQAIAELRLALDSDKDGSLHYQVARLYLKVGDRASANQAFEVSKRIQREALMHATVAMEQGTNDTESQ